jgi:type III pantothenate kinase
VMLLALDIGNSTTKAGIFRNKQLLAWDAVATDSKAGELKIWLKALLASNGLERKDFSGVAGVSVVPSRIPRWETLVQNQLGLPIFFVRGNTRTCLTVKYRPQASLGGDRLAAALAASHFYAPPLICASLGTATVVDAVTRDREFLGGAILPGVDLFGKALAAGTALLPETKPVGLPPLIGDNTRDAIRAGAIFGTAYAVEGMVRAYRKQLGGRAKFIITGGFAPLIVPQLALAGYYRPALILEGIRLAWEDGGRRRQ